MHHKCSLIYLKLTTQSIELNQPTPTNLREGNLLVASIFTVWIPLSYLPLIEIDICGKTKQVE